MVLNRIQVCVSGKTGITLTDFNGVAALHQASNEMNEMKRLLFFTPVSITETNSIL